MRPVAERNGEPVDLLLLNPAIEIDHPQEMFYKYFELQEEQINLGLAALAAYLRVGGASFEIIDSNLEKLSVEETVARVLRNDYRGLGFSLNIYNLGPTMRIIQKLREAGRHRHVTAGGAFASLYAEMLLSNFPVFDSMVYGDGESAACELAVRLRRGLDWRDSSGILYRRENGHLSRNGHVRVTADLDMLPRPLRYGGAGVQPVELARGCYGHCSFCALRAFYDLSGNDAPRRRSLSSFFDEVEALLAQGSRDIGVQADSFFPSSDPAVADEYLDSFIGEIRKRGLDMRFFIACRADEITERRLRALKAGGLAGIFVGIESINTEELKAFKKGISPEQARAAIALMKAHDVNFDCGYIFFSPWTTVPDLIRSASFMLETGLEHFSYGAYRMKAHAGTAATRQIRETGLSDEAGVLSGTGIERLYLRYRFQDPAVGFIWEQADALYRTFYAFILEEAMEVYQAGNNLIRPKTIGDRCVLGLIIDLARAVLQGRRGLDEWSRERTAFHLKYAREAVLADLKAAMEA